MKKIRQKDPFVYWSDEEWDGKKIDLPKIDKKKITSKYNPYALQLNFAKNGLKSEYNISLLYALTTLLIPNDKTDERYNLNMDLFKKSYLGDGDFLNQKYKSKFKADTDSSVVQFMVNNMASKEGKAGILLNTIDSDFVICAKSVLSP